MLRVGYEKIAPRHYRRHLVEPGGGRTLCGMSVEVLAHLHPLLEPSSFLAIGVDGEACKKCAVKASVDFEWHREAPRLAPAPASP